MAQPRDTERSANGGWEVSGELSTVQWLRLIRFLFGDDAARKEAVRLHVGYIEVNRVSPSVPTTEEFYRGTPFEFEATARAAGAAQEGKGHD